MIVYDIDSIHVNIHNIKLLLRGVNELDPHAVWCNFGEDFRIVEGDVIKPYWGTYESYVVRSTRQELVMEFGLLLSRCWCGIGPTQTV